MIVGLLDKLLRRIVQTPVVRSLPTNNKIKSKTVMLRLYLIISPLGLYVLS